MTDGVTLVTGVGGFVGSHVARVLLEAGLQVRGTVRSLADEAKLAPIRALAPNAPHPLELVEADLTKDDGWDKAVEGCSGVMHVASPFPDVTSKKVTVEELMGPARDGTLRVLRAAAAARVTRVVLTSSFAAICGEAEVDPNKTYNEECWTDVDSPTIDPYTRSKAAAEKTAWDFVNELPEESRFELAVVNPVLVLGPPLLESQKGGTSINIMSQLLNRSIPAVPRVSFPVCDVRDVALAHYKALTVAEAANRRHLVSSSAMWFRDIAVTVSREFRPQGYSIPTSQLPYAALWLLACFNSSVKHNILPRVGKVISIDNSRMTGVLGVEPRPMESTILDMVYAMIDLGMVRKAKKYKQVGSRAEVPAVNGEVEEKKEGEEEKKGGEGEGGEEGEKKELEPEDKEEKKEAEEIKEDPPAEKEGEKKEEVETEKKEEGGGGEVKKEGGGEVEK